MRPIKFRAWDKVNKKYVSVGSCYLIIKVGDVTKFIPNDPERFILLQYTGLKDKNGMESCGHDVAKITFDEFYSNAQFCCEEGESVTGIIKQIDYAWAVELPGKSYVFFSEIVNGEMDMEVIGNIYENPELVKS